jgi:hypothetical protein
MIVPYIQILLGEPGGCLAAPVDQQEELRGRVFFPNDPKWKYGSITAEISESDRL